ncbi:DUF1592 domain-containing protein [Verrucomicrobiales bacterium]|nr:DUF1592 domain-containing protein [Verrucomicrobiales bacterium]MDB4632418.1 DUF1592 domain-containing protein [bacterium]
MKILHGILLLVSASLWLTPFPAQGEEGLRKATLTFFEAHCYRCHGEEKQKGRFRLDTLTTDVENPLVAEKWAEVRFRINAGEMPPEDEAQPTAEEIGGVVDELTQKIQDGAAARMAKRGLVNHYRLSRQEYAHTIYDLLGVVFDVEAPGAFNEDPLWHGFDRIGALLSVAPSHIDRYLSAADTVVALAFPEAEIPSETKRHSASEGKRRLLQLGESWRFHLKHPGRYRITIHGSGLPAFTGRIPHLSLWHHHHKRSFAGADLMAIEGRPSALTFEGLFPAGDYDVRNHARTQRHANGSLKLFRNEEIDAAQPIASLKTQHPSPWTKVVDDEGRPVMPTLLLDWIQVEGPILTESDLAKCEGVFPTDKTELSEQLTALRRFAERAWRRPVVESELDRYLRFIATEQEAGESFATAYRSVLTSILVSRSFFHIEMGSPDENRLLLNDFELANRLSYFLWSSMPDDLLFAAARRGDLSTSEGLAAQLDRMMADPKIERFLHSFPKQWLQLHRVGMFQPDPELYPEYDPWLEESMRQETIAYFTEMFQKNLPLRQAVDSNWTMLNARLAYHYGFPRPSATGFTRVELLPDSGRGGILTHASVLSLTSDGTRHRPVHRGAWLSEAILAFTPSPPPPNVDPLEPVAADKPKATIRAQLEAHATSPNCVSCHAKIDPLGLAFENFDAIGRWRDTERIREGMGVDPPVDPSGVLPDGRSFANASEFKKLLADDERRLAEAFLEQVATYALRRVMTVDDTEQLHTIVATAGHSEDGVKSIMRGLVLSELFKKR